MFFQEIRGVLFDDNVHATVRIRKLPPQRLRIQTGDVQRENCENSRIYGSNKWEWGVLTIRDSILIVDASACNSENHRKPTLF